MQSNVLSGELENIYRVECNQMYWQVMSENDVFFFSFFRLRMRRGDLKMDGTNFYMYIGCI